MPLSDYWDPDEDTPEGRAFRRQEELPDRVPVLVCRPVDLAELSKIAPHLPESPIYENSVKGECRLCTEPIWIGPRVAVVRELEPTAVTICFMCAARVGITPDEVQHLGNMPKEG